MILGSLQAHASTQIIDNQGGANCPTIGTTDLGMPKIVEMNENIKTDVVAMIDDESWNESTRRIYGTTGIAPTLNTCGGGHQEPKIVEKMEEPFIAAARGWEPQVLTAKRTEYGKQVRKQYESGELKASRHTMQQLEPRNDGVSNTLASVEKDNYVCEPEFEGCAVHPLSHKLEFKGWDKGKSPALRATDYKAPVCVKETRYRIRKLTPRECFRLMGCDEPTIDKLLNAGISNSQLYKLAGNSIVVDVLTAIFDKMFVHTEQSVGDQLTLF
jgi:DNA (cytosine-5)-methyltransferase 1